ncbi:MAG: phage major capsid protein, partial [candidate division WOR-3 bacterium]
KRVDELKKNIVKRKGQFQIDESDNSPVVNIHKMRSNDEKVIEFQKRADDLFIVSRILNRDPRELKMYKSFRKYLEETELAKAMDTVTAGAGLEWIPTDFSRELIDKVQLELRVAALFPRIAMPTDPFKLPAKSSFSTARKGVENTAPTASSVGTTNVTLDAVKIIDYVPISYELEEDAVVAMLPVVKDDIANAIARAQEDATINGDDSSPHMDSDVTSAEDCRKCWKGLRKYAIANGYTRDLSTFNLETLNLLVQDMGKYGVLPSKLAWIAGTKVLAKLRVLTDANDNPVMTTMDKLGPKATVLTGMVGEVLGIPVIPSEFIREDLNASGVYDGSVTSYTCLPLVRTDGFIYGDRRSLMIEQDRIVKQQSIDIVASARVAFAPRYAIASNRIVALGVKIS